MCLFCVFWLHAFKTAPNRRRTSESLVCWGWAVISTCRSFWPWQLPSLLGKQEKTERLDAVENHCIFAKCGEWCDAGTGYPGKLWMPHDFKCSKSGWMEQPDLVEGTSGHGSGIRLDDLWKVPSNANHPMILWQGAKFGLWGLRYFLMLWWKNLERKGWYGNCWVFVRGGGKPLRFSLVDKKSGTFCETTRKKQSMKPWVEGIMARYSVFCWLSLITLRGKITLHTWKWHISQFFLFVEIVCDFF